MSNTLEQIREDLKGKVSVKKLHEIDRRHDELKVDLEWTSFGLPCGMETAIVQNNNGCIVDFQILDKEYNRIRIWVKER